MYRNFKWKENTHIEKILGGMDHFDLAWLVDISGAAGDWRKLRIDQHHKN
jgi:hypothetical protein